MIIRKLRFSLPINFILLGVFLSGCASVPALPGVKTEQTQDRRVEFALVKHDGADTVVFENGLGANFDSWAKVIPEISRDTTTFAYNRPGYGKSSEVSTPRDGMHIVDELRPLLRSQGLRPPYILVGHSFGGLCMQYFLHRYPDEVKALILVDSTPALHFNGRNPKDTWPFWLKIGFWLWASRVNEEEFAGIPRTGDAVLALPTAAGIPVIVLSAVKAIEGHPEQADLSNISEETKSVARLYPGSKQVWVVSGHDIPRIKPEPIISSIREALSKSDK